MRSATITMLDAMGLKNVFKSALNYILPRTRKNGVLLRYSLRHKSHQERNQFILERLPQAPAWILDIGSNTGETSNFLASKGYYVLGCEIMKQEMQFAVQNASSGAAFMNTEINSPFLSQMPYWDAILLLSVLHRMYALSGPHTMRETLRLCGEKSGIIFLECSTRHARYTDMGQPPPAFSDLDVADCDRWHKELIKDSLGEAWSITDSVVLEQSEIEPYRITYKLVKC